MLKAIKKITSFTFLPNYELRQTISTYSDDLTGSILDFGCGTKPYEYLFHHCDKYIGLDTRNSGHNHQKSRADIFFDGFKIPFPDETFDAVVSFQVLEHVSDSKFALDEMYRVLKKTGKLLITAPLIWPEHEVPYDFKRWTSYGISKKLSECGFIIVRQDKVGSAITVISSLFLDAIGSGRGFFGKALSRIVALLLNLIVLAGLYCGVGRAPNRTIYLDNIVLAKK
jgi:SAM-dependent methyltransferase